MNVRTKLLNHLPESIFTLPLPKPARGDCLFYHSFDLPLNESIVGDWDMRGKFDDYTGYVDLGGKSVLDIGTASGFLSFESEMRGATVVSFDAHDTSMYTRLPHATGRFASDPEKAILDDNNWLDAVKRSYWYVYHALGSENLVHYGNLYNMPFFRGAFDVTIIGQFLVHNRSGIDLLIAAAATTHDYLIITEGTFEAPTPTAHFLGSADRPEDYFSNWLYSSSFYMEMGRMLGFKLQRFEIRPFACNVQDHPESMDLGVFVFRRV